MSGRFPKDCWEKHCPHFKDDFSFRRKDGADNDRPTTSPDSDGVYSVSAKKHYDWESLIDRNKQKLKEREQV